MKKEKDNSPVPIVRTICPCCEKYITIFSDNILFINKPLEYWVKIEHFARANGFVEGLNE